MKTQWRIVDALDVGVLWVLSYSCERRGWVLLVWLGGFCRGFVVVFVFVYVLERFNGVPVVFHSYDAFYAIQNIGFCLGSGEMIRRLSCKVCKRVEMCFFYRLSRSCEVASSRGNDLSCE